MIRDRKPTPKKSATKSPRRPSSTEETVVIIHDDASTEDELTELTQGIIDVLPATMTVGDAKEMIAVHTEVVKGIFEGLTAIGLNGIESRNYLSLLAELVSLLMEREEKKADEKMAADVLNGIITVIASPKKDTSSSK